MKAFIRRWLGIIDISIGQGMILNRISQIETFLQDSQTITLADRLALGRIIAKIDPAYGVDQHSPERIAESNKLAKATLARLHAEAKTTRRP